MRAEARPLNLDLLVTRACPMRCAYCRMRRRAGPMPERVWRRALDLLLREESPLELQLMGGEPLAEYGAVREIAAAAAREAARRGKSLRLVLTTNGLLLSPERSRELAGLGVRVMLSLDGDRDVQEANRSGSRSWGLLRRNLAGLLRSGADCFVNLVATPETAGRLRESAAFLLGEGVRRFQVAYALGLSWGEDSLRILEEQLRAACRLARAARPAAEVFNRRNGAEPVLLSPQHLVDTDGQLYVGTSVVLERLWPGLQEAFRVGPVAALIRLPGRRRSPADQLRLLRGARLAAPARRVLLNNLAVGARMRRFWRDLEAS